MPGHRRCEIAYHGRAVTRLGAGDRVIIFKEDDSLCVHADNEFKPLNSNLTKAPAPISGSGVYGWPVSVERVQLRDGRIFEYCLSGDQGSGLLVFHPGTLSAATEYPFLSDAAAARGLRTAVCSRPGYGGSTRHPGRTVADAAGDAAELADHLNAESFWVAGWSGGGHAALACAALLPDRVRACITLAGPAPPAEVGDRWMEWGGDPESDRDEMATLATKPEEFASKYEEDAARSYADVTAETLMEFPGFAASDIAALRDLPVAAAACARSMRLAAAGGALGWLDDDSACAKPWGFHMADIRVPVVIRHGDADGWVPVQHARWLADHIPDARLDEVPGGGHMSVGIPFEPVVSALLEAVR